MDTITIVSLLSDNHQPFYCGVADYLAWRTGIPTRFVGNVSWQVREQMLRDGCAQVGFVCGQVYAHETKWLSLLAAPVLRYRR
jgi:hypothetical protein